MSAKNGRHGQQGYTLQDGRFAHPIFASQNDDVGLVVERGGGKFQDKLVENLEILDCKLPKSESRTVFHASHFPIPFDSSLRYTLAGIFYTARGRS